jgi:hypothetical protein
MKYHICCICNKEKLITDFYKDNSKKFGISDTCKVCSKKYSREYAQNHHNKVIEYQNEYREKNKNKKQEYQKQYYEKNKKELRAYRAKYKNEHEEEIKEQQKQYRLKYPEKIKNHDLLSGHGITLNDYNKMLKEQNNGCAICGNPETDKEVNKKVKSLSVDHDHKTGKVRGLLCSKCNKGIGLFQDNIKLLQSAINYLKNK